MPVYKDTSKKTNQWYVKCRYKDYTGTRKQKTKRGFKYERDAKKWETNFLARYQKSPEMPFSSVVAEYLDDKKDNCKEITYETSKSRINTWILPTFSDQPIKDIDADSIRLWKNSLKRQLNRKGKPLSDNYIRNLVVELHSIFSFAVDYKGLDKNPVTTGGRKAGKRTKRCDYWTTEEFQRFIATFPEHDVFYTIFMTLYWTGMRLGELMALTVADVSPERINIDKTYHMINGRGVVTSPKTEKSVREVDITPELAAILREYINKLYHPKKNDRLFPIGDSSISRHFKIHAEAAGLPCIRLHDLRHSHASLLINNGADVLLVSDRLGHESPETTLKTYSHLFKERKTDVVNMLSKIWFS